MILDGGCMLDIGESATISNKYLALIAEREQKYYEANLQEYGEKPDETFRQKDGERDYILNLVL